MGTGFEYVPAKLWVQTLRSKAAELTDFFI